MCVCGRWRSRRRANVAKSELVLGELHVPLDFAWRAPASLQAAWRECATAAGHKDFVVAKVFMKQEDPL